MYRIEIKQNSILSRFNGSSHLFESAIAMNDIAVVEIRIDVFGLSKTARMINPIVIAKWPMNIDDKKLLFIVILNRSVFLRPPNTPFTGAGQVWVRSSQRVYYGVDVVGGVKN